MIASVAVDYHVTRPGRGLMAQATASIQAAYVVPTVVPTLSIISDLIAELEKSVDFIGLAMVAGGGLEPPTSGL